MRATSVAEAVAEVAVASCPRDYYSGFVIIVREAATVEAPIGRIGRRCCFRRDLPVHLPMAQVELEAEVVQVPMRRDPTRRRRAAQEAPGPVIELVAEVIIGPC